MIYPGGQNIQNIFLGEDTQVRQIWHLNTLLWTAFDPITYINTSFVDAPVPELLSEGFYVTLIGGGAKGGTGDRGGGTGGLGTARGGGGGGGGARIDRIFIPKESLGSTFSLAWGLGATVAATAGTNSIFTSGDISLTAGGGQPGGMANLTFGASSVGGAGGIYTIEGIEATGHNGSPGGNGLTLGTGSGAAGGDNANGAGAGGGGGGATRTGDQANAGNDTRGGRGGNSRTVLGPVPTAAAQAGVQPPSAEVGEGGAGGSGSGGGSTGKNGGKGGAWGGGGGGAGGQFGGSGNQTGGNGNDGLVVLEMV